MLTDRKSFFMKNEIRLLSIYFSANLKKKLEKPIPIVANKLIKFY